MVGSRADRRLVIVDAPSNLGLRPPAPGREPGVKRLAQTLRAHGLVERLHALDGGGVAPGPYSFAFDPAAGARNVPGVRQFALDLAVHLTPILDRGAVPVVLGGDCSVLLGPMLALRARGRFGLIFIDGHDDLLQPATSATGGAAGMDLALLLGHGPPPLRNLRQLGPLARAEDVAVLGVRAGWTNNPVMRDLRQRQIGAALALDEVRRLGIAAAVDRALAVANGPGTAGFWVHLDADVLDHAIMPAVDSPLPGGLRYDELRPILRRLLASGRLAGMTVTIFDPDLDPDGSIAAGLVAALADGLGPGPDRP